MTNTATRLISLIMLLQRSPNRKAGDLARELGVSIRTVHRYFEMLDELGIPLYSERGPAGGFSLVRGYNMPPLVLSPEEAVAVGLGVSLVEEMWGALYRDAARGALAKLENLLPDDQRQEIAWARRSLVAAGLQRSELGAIQTTLETLRSALRETRRVRLVYEAGGRAPTRWSTAGGTGTRPASATCAGQCACCGWTASARSVSWSWATPSRQVTTRMNFLKPSCSPSRRC
jgi:predicted DNA-binding transcriptional regulator YafY